MQDPKLLESLFDRKLIRILKLLMLNKNRQFYLREIAKETRVPPATTHRLLSKLLSLDLITLHKFNKFKLYQLAQNDNTEFLEGFIKEGKRIVASFIDEIKTIQGLEAVYQISEDDYKSSLLLIGEQIDSNEIKRLSALYKEKYMYTITTLTLAQEQFEQMSAMGLYAGRKIVLYKKL